MAIERWRSRYGAHLIEWMSCVGELEALLSISTYSFEHPADVMPEVLLEDPLFDAEGIGHPFLDESACVRNDIKIGGGTEFVIVSGSNMSGKKHVFAGNRAQCRHGVHGSARPLHSASAFGPERSRRDPNARFRDRRFFTLSGDGFLRRPHAPFRSRTAIRNCRGGLAQLAKLDAAFVARISEYRRIIAFRNILIHGYAEVDDRLVWDIVEAKLPVLQRDNPPETQLITRRPYMQERGRRA